MQLATTTQYQYSRSEKSLMTGAAILATIMSFFYVTDISIRKILFPTKEERLLSTAVGKVISSNGQTQRQRADDFEFKSIGVGSSLYPNDTLTTGGNSHLKFQLSSGETIDLEPNSLIKLSFGSDFAVTGVVKISIVKVETKPVIVERAPVIIPKITPKPVKIIPQLAVTKLNPPNGTQFTFSVEDYTKGRKLIPINIGVNTNERQIKVQLFQTNNGLKKEILSKSPEKSLEYELSTQFNSAGNYEIVVLNEEGQVIKDSNFAIKREIKLIQPLPTQGGTNRISGAASKKEFDGFLLSWKMQTVPLPSDASINEFHLKVYNRDSQKLLLERSVKTSEMILNKNNLILGKLYYTVEHPLRNGFIATSPREEFGYEFLPPDLTSPPDRGIITDDYLASHNGVIFLTWSKTNFATRYELELSDSAEFSKTILKKQLLDNFDSITFSKKMTYFWRVRSFSQDKWTGFSRPRSFILK